jgi:uncharacterized protein
MLTKKSAIKLVTDFAREVNENGTTLHKVILFGSFAKNKQHQWSDIDVAMVSDKFKGIGFEDMKSFVSVLIKKPYYIIEPRTYPTAYFKKGDPFIDEIKKTGIEIKLK